MRTTRLLRGCCTVMALLFSHAIGRADVVGEWNAIMVATVSGQSPFDQARFAAITQMAVFEAVMRLRAITSRTSVRSHGQPAHRLRRLPSPPHIRCSGITSRAARRAWMPARASSLAAIPDGPAKSAGITAGDAAAAAMIAARADELSSHPIAPGMLEAKGSVERPKAFRYERKTYGN